MGNNGVRQRTNTGGGTTSRVGGEKREKEGNGRIYNDDKWTCTPRHLPGRACHTAPFPPTFFPFLFSPRYPHILSWNPDLPPPLLPLLALSFPCSFFSCLCPCHLFFFTSAPHPTHRLPKRHQPITSQIFRSPRISLLNLASSPHLTFSYLTSPALPCSPQSPGRHVLQLACHASVNDKLRPDDFRLDTCPEVLLEALPLRTSLPIASDR